MKTYRYRQNNSGGFFTFPAINVYVNAQTNQEADTLAMENGVYFGYGPEDCDCCDKRWSAGEEWDYPIQLELTNNDLSFLYGDIPWGVIINKKENN